MEQPSQNKTDVFGIISIVMAFTGLALVGLILGIIGVSKAKKDNRPATLSHVGWILNLVMMFLFTVGLIMMIVFSSVPALQQNSRDQQRKTEIAVLSSDIEQFYVDNGYYPSSLLDLSSADTTDPQGKPYIYIPTPEGCVECTGYSVQTVLENGQVYMLNSR